VGAILVRLANASRVPLQDRVDVHVVSASTDATVSAARNVPGHAQLRFDKLIERHTYLIKVFPERHRPVAQFVMAGSDEEPATVTLYAPLHPQHVRAATFPDYAAVHTDLRTVLESSTVDGRKGPDLFGVLGNTQKAGLFNLFAKMTGFAFDDRRTIWSYVDRLTAVRGDRIFADVQLPLRELVEKTTHSEKFRAVSGSLHEPPTGFGHSGSFKSAERYGNLQLTFFSSLATPLAYKVDADIDDAAGLGHAFQVLRNFVTHGTTHPYDIHQILVFRQDASLPYDLA
jgi:hypothetical protein